MIPSEAETYPNFEDDTATAVRVQIVQAILVVAAQVRVGHRLPEGDSAAEAAFALELDDRRARSTVVPKRGPPHSRE